MRLVAVFLLAVVSALLVPAPAAAAGHQVMMMNYAYSATTLTVRVGDTITWTNHDDAPHDVVAGGFRSPLLQKGQSWTFTVSAAGTYPYYCSVHPDMRAQVVVLAQDPVAPPPQRVTPTTTARQPAATTTTTAPATTASSAAPQPDQAAQAGQAAAAAPAPGVVGQRLDPMLIVAGIVAAVAVLCLLLLSARPDT